MTGMCLSIYLSIYLFVCLSIYLSIYPSIHLSIYPSIHLSIYRSIDLSIYRSIDLSIYLSIYISIYLYLSLSIYLSIHPSIHLSIYLVHLSNLIKNLIQSDLICLTMAKDCPFSLHAYPAAFESPEMSHCQESCTSERPTEAASPSRYAKGSLRPSAARHCHGQEQQEFPGYR